MNVTIQISPETYDLLRRRANEMKSTPEQIAETAIRLQLGNTVHIEQKQRLTGHKPICAAHELQYATWLPF